MPDPTVIEKLMGPVLVAERYICILFNVGGTSTYAFFYDTWNALSPAYPNGSTTVADMVKIAPVAKVTLQISAAEMANARWLASGPGKAHFTTNTAIYTITEDFKVFKQCTLQIPDDKAKDWYSTPTAAGGIFGYAGVIRHDGLCFMIRDDSDTGDLLRMVYDRNGTLVETPTVFDISDAANATFTVLDSGDIVVLWNAGAGDPRASIWNVGTFEALDDSALSTSLFGTTEDGIMPAAFISQLDGAASSNNVLAFNAAQQPAVYKTTYVETGNTETLVGAKATAAPSASYDYAAAQMGPSNRFLLASMEPTARAKISVRNFNAGELIESTTADQSAPDERPEDIVSTWPTGILGYTMFPASYDLGGYARRFLGVM